MARLLPFGIDILIVLAFAVIGRLSHAREMSLSGFFSTAWPFLVACLVAWVVISLISADGYGVQAGVIVWLVTLVGGLALRIAFGDTAALPFVIVAMLVLLAGFAGWRLIAWLLRRRASDAVHA